MYATQNNRHNQPSQQQCPGEDDLCRAYGYYVDRAIAEAKAKGLITRHGISGNEVEATNTGHTLCLYYAAVRSNADLPNVQLPQFISEGATKRLQSSTCPSRFLDAFHRWAEVVPLVKRLSRAQQSELEQMICDVQDPLAAPPMSGISIPRLGISPIHDIANHLSLLSYDIQRYQVEPPQRGRTKAPPIVTKLTWPEPNIPELSPASREAPNRTPYGNQQLMLPGLHPSPLASPKVSPQHSPALSFPEPIGRPRSSTSSKCPGPNTGGVDLASSGPSNNMDNFIGGFARRRTLTNPSTSPNLHAPSPFPVPFGMPEPQLGRALLDKAGYRNSYFGMHNIGDIADSTDRITAVISSNTSIPNIITSLEQHGCQNLSQQLDGFSCSSVPVSRGGFGEVYRGKLRDGTPVAIKTIFIHNSSQDQEHKYIKRTARELYTWSKCKHPNVAKLLGLVEFRDQIAMVSLWMDDGDLRTYVNKNPNVDRLRLCEQTADGLAYLHSIGIIHGDLKGPNVLISKEGVATVIDFGNAVLGESTLQFTDAATSQKVSIRWTAPEVLKGGKHSPEADVYALGMTILEAFTGKAPHSEKDNRTAMLAITKGEIPERPHEQIPTGERWGDDLWGLLIQCWNHAPERRPTGMDVREFVLAWVRMNQNTDVYYQQQFQQARLEEGEICRGYDYYVNSAINEAKAKNLISRQGTGGGGADVLFTGAVLCLYYAALRSETGLSSVQLPHFSGDRIQKRLQSSTCPTRFLDLFNQWDAIVLRVKSLPRPYQIDLERIICNEPPLTVPPVSHFYTPQPGAPSIHDIVNDLRSLASNISRHQFVPSQPARTSAPPILTTSMWPEANAPMMPLAPHEAPYPAPHNVIPSPQYGFSSSPRQSPRPPSHPLPRSSPWHGSTLDLPEHFSPPGLLTPLQSPSPSIGGPIAAFLGPNHGQGDFVGGFVSRGRRSTSPSLISSDSNVPFPSAVPFGMPEPQTVRGLFRNKTVGHTRSPVRDLNDATGSTTQIAAKISSNMPISDIIASLGQHGCYDLSHQLDISTCSKHPISRGGFSDIYFGKLYDGTPVAIKAIFIHSNESDQEHKHLKRTARELHTWSKCKHSNVAKLLGLAEFRDQIAMVSLWMENGDLRAYLRNYPNVDRLRLCSQVADGLAYLHSTGIVSNAADLSRRDLPLLTSATTQIHGDLKGPNVLISKEGIATLIDFGNAVLGESTLQFTDTATNQKMSIRWTAPEILEGGKHSAEADVYALGMTILEALTGKVPYFQKNDPAVMTAIMRNEYPLRPQECIPVNTKWGDALWALLTRCWDHVPKRRPAAIEVRDLLNTFGYDAIPSTDWHYQAFDT